MNNNKVLLICVAFFLNFCLNNVSFAIVDLSVPNRYPDYAYEFTGKDKCERFNRKLFIFNLKLNKYVLRPLNIGWASIMPEYGMDRFKNFYNNTNYPVRLVGCLLQKDFKASRQETVRFLTNTTIGLAGLYDPAKNWLKIEPKEEDIGQALAHCKKIKQGPYLVLPIVRGSLRDLIGLLLDYPFRPFSYIPIGGGIANAVCFINNTTYIQPLIKKVETTYADPYEVIRQADGVESYIKIANLDRTDVFKEKIASQNIIKISNISSNPDLKPDITLNDYNPQSPLIDAMRTSLFDNQNFNKTIWADMSVWNRSFDKKIKTTSANIYPKRSNYKYRYILQKDKNAPVAIIYPSIGEGIMADKSIVQAKMLYDEGYSVIILGSTCQWEFVKSMPTNFRPGLPNQDAQYLRTTTAKVLEDIQNKNRCNFGKKIVVGTSFGALTALFVGAQEENDNTLNVSRYIAINPPVETFFALNQVDKYSQDWKNDPTDIKMRAAITVEKVLLKTKDMTDKHIKDRSTYFPFTDDEAKLILGFVMKQKLSDLVFTIENGSTSKKCDLYKTINNMSFVDYAQKYLFANQTKPITQLGYEASLYSISDFLQKSPNYKIYHSVDDYYANPQQLTWLKNQSGNKSVFFSNGSHLGCLYRQEFIEEFKKDIKLDKIAPSDKNTEELTEFDELNEPLEPCEYIDLEEAKKGI